MNLVHQAGVDTNARGLGPERSLRVLILKCRSMCANALELNAGWMCGPRYNSSLLYLGPRDSGTNFHSHKVLVLKCVLTGCPTCKGNFARFESGVPPEWPTCRAFRLPGMCCFEAKSTGAFGAVQNVCYSLSFMKPTPLLCLRNRLLFPPSEVEGVGPPWFHQESVRSWFQKNFRWAVAHGALQCTQLAGDVMYIPGHWQHAVINTQTVAGFTQQTGIAKNMLQNTAILAEALIR